MRIKKITRKKCKPGETFYCVQVPGNDIVVRAGDRDIAARNCGFGFLFGMSAMAFSANTLRIEWSAEQCTAFVEQFGLTELRDTLRSQDSRGMSDDDIAYLTVATFFRTEFFKIYKRLEEWINDCGTDASMRGFVVSPFGARRLLPQRTYQGRDDEKGVIKNLSNISVNSPVQDFETIFMARVMINSREKMKKYGMKSHLIGTVHDSIVGFSHKDEEPLVFKIILEEFQKDFPEANGIPYMGELNLAKPENGEVWGLGKQEISYEDVKSVPYPVRTR
jgi:DNA polymerase I-like protein with 3'-5' exonuclease and polymerase domains